VDAEAHPQPWPPRIVNDHERDLEYAFLDGDTVQGLAEISIAEHLAEGAHTVKKIAASEGAPEQTSLWLLKACVAEGLLMIDDRGRFHGTRELALLRKEAPARDLALNFVIAAVVGRGREIERTSDRNELTAAFVRTRCFET
jgi:hypothetical protein